ncbi:signal peptidase I, partial [Candidatus Berkelbacteria bacterium CG_4_9_14_3_um_filter_33_5]
SKTLNKDEYFVLGDNRNNSQDSRSIGPISKENITGRVFLVIYPFSNARIVRASEGFKDPVY